MIIGLLVFCFLAALAYPELFAPSDQWWEDQAVRVCSVRHARISLARGGWMPYPTPAKLNGYTVQAFSIDGKRPTRYRATSGSARYEWRTLSGLTTIIERGVYK